AVRMPHACPGGTHARLSHGHSHAIESAADLASSYFRRTRKCPLLDGILACTVDALAAHLIAACAPVAVSDTHQVTEVLAAEPRRTASMRTKSGSAGGARPAPSQSARSRPPRTRAAAWSSSARPVIADPRSIRNPSPGVLG